MAATISAGLAPGKSISDGIDAMNVKAKVLDDTFTTDLGGESRDFVESSSNTAFAFGLALVLIFLILAAKLHRSFHHHHFDGSYGSSWCIILPMVVRPNLEYL
jgi:multidrug efflux pump subunit AcrB